MKKTCLTCFVLVTICLISSYSGPVIQAETKEIEESLITETEEVSNEYLLTDEENRLSQSTDMLEDEDEEKDKTEIVEEDTKDEGAKPSTSIGMERQVGFEEGEGKKTEAEAEEGEKRIEESESPVIIIPDRKEAGSSQFQPEVITVKVNEKIMWVNNDSRTHFIGTMVIEEYPTGRDEDVEEDDEEEDDEEEEGEWEVPEHYFTSGDLSHGAKFEHSFDTPGVIIYYCYVHPLEQRGKIIVVEDKP